MTQLHVHACRLWHGCKMGQTNTCIHVTRQSKLASFQFHHLSPNWLSASANSHWMSESTLYETPGNIDYYICWTKVWLLDTLAKLLLPTIMENMSKTQVLLQLKTAVSLPTEPVFPDNSTCGYDCGCSIDSGWWIDCICSWTAEGRVLYAWVPFLLYDY